MSAARSSAAWLLRLCMGGLLAAAGVLKLRDPAGFAVEISNFQLLPALAPYLAAALPATELVLGLCLIAAPRGWRRAAVAGALLLFAGFTVAVASAYLRGINIVCGCFGGGGDAIGPLTLVRNTALLVALAALWVCDAPPRTAPRAS